MREHSFVLSSYRMSKEKYLTAATKCKKECTYFAVSHLYKFCVLIPSGITRQLVQNEE